MGRLRSSMCVHVRCSSSRLICRFASRCGRGGSAGGGGAPTCQIWTCSAVRLLERASVVQLSGLGHSMICEAGHTALVNHQHPSTDLLLHSVSLSLFRRPLCAPGRAVA